MINLYKINEFVWRLFYYQQKILAYHIHFVCSRPKRWSTSLKWIFLVSTKKFITWEHKWACGWKIPRRRRQSSFDVKIQSPSTPVQQGLAKTEKKLLNNSNMNYKVRFYL